MNNFYGNSQRTDMSCALRAIFSAQRQPLLPSAFSPRGEKKRKMLFEGHRVSQRSVHPVIAGVARQFRNHPSAFFVSQRDTEKTQRYTEAALNVIAGATRNPLRMMAQAMILAIFFAAAGVYAQPCTPITTVGIGSSDAVASTIIKKMDYYGAWSTPADASATFTATASGGSVAAAYEWYVNGALQIGATGATFVFNLPAGVEGEYSVYAAAVNGCTESNTARSGEMVVFAAKDKKKCLSQGSPSPFTTSLGCPGTYTIDLAAATSNDCTSSITYQWEESDDNSSWSNVPGGTDASYTIDVWEDIVKYYRRKAICDCGSVTSASALIAITVSFRPPPVFMDYNLGADPSIADPKSQMAYLASGSYGGELDARVFGGLYQWGRMDLPYAMSTDGSYLRYTGNGVANHSIALDAGTPVYNSDGQITYVGVEQTDDLHVYSAAPYDWRGATPDGSTHVTCDVDFQCDTLWGNGVAINDPTDPDGWYYNGNYYQKIHRTINDPCPPNWCVPTQDDWERLTNYCDPSAAGGTSSTPPAMSGGIWNTSTGLTWVAVRCGGGSCVPSTASWSQSTPGGYAIYETSVWERASSDYKNGTLSLHTSGAPQAVLFLPAAGGRSNNNGTLYDAGMGGNYWSSSVGGPYSYILNFNNTGATPDNNGYRASGFSVRCVAADPYLEVSPTGYVFREGGVGNAKVFTVKTNQWWSFSVSGANVSDFEVYRDGSTIVVYPKTTNTNTVTREMSITVTAGSLMQTVTVEQPEYMNITVDPVPTYLLNGQTVTVTFNTTHPWSASLGGDVGIITNSPTLSGGAGAGSITFTLVTDNTNSNSTRTMTITFTGAFGTETVNLVGQRLYLLLSPTNNSVPLYDPTNLDISILTNLPTGLAGVTPSITNNGNGIITGVSIVSPNLRVNLAAAQPTAQTGTVQIVYTSGAISLSSSANVSRIANPFETFGSYQVTPFLYATFWNVHTNNVSCPAGSSIPQNQAEVNALQSAGAWVGWEAFWNTIPGEKYGVTSYVGSRSTTPATLGYYQYMSFQPSLPRWDWTVDGNYSRDNQYIFTRCIKR